MDEYTVKKGWFEFQCDKKSTLEQAKFDADEAVLAAEEKYSRLTYTKSTAAQQREAAAAVDDAREAWRKAEASWWLVFQSLTRFNNCTHERVSHLTHEGEIFHVCAHCGAEMEVVPQVEKAEVEHANRQ